jgi:hypothetical protein
MVATLKSAMQVGIAAEDVGQSYESIEVDDGNIACGQISAATASATSSSC